MGAHLEISNGDNNHEDGKFIDKSVDTKVINSDISDPEPIIPLVISLTLTIVQKVVFYDKMEFRRQIHRYALEFPSDESNIDELEVE